MPVPRTGEVTRIIDEGVYTVLEGITHIVVTDKEKQKNKTARETLESLLDEDTYGVNELPSLGVCYYDTDTRKAEFAVWVKEVKTIFDETACGSGSGCIGMAMATLEKDDFDGDIIQPTGQIINAYAKFDKKKSVVTSSTIAGKVDVLFDDVYTI